MSLDIENPEQLLGYLRSQGHIGITEAPEIRVLAGGVSNRTVWVKRQSGESWVLKQALEKLRTKAEWFSSLERIHREAAGMRWLYAKVPGRITRLIFEDPAHHLLAMEAVAEPHQNWKSMLLKGELEFGHVRQFAELLGQIHQQSYLNEQARAEFAERSFFESLRLEPYYLYTASQVQRAADFLRQLVEENRTNLLCVVHGDYSPKNVLIYADRLILLDHEVIHFGDPTFDLGFSMTHLLSKAHHVVDQREKFFEAAQLYWKHYVQTATSPVAEPGFESRAVRQTLGCMLGRVDGRSPLEYLSKSERSRQRQAVLALMKNPPPTFNELIVGFAERIFR